MLGHNPDRIQRFFGFHSFVLNLALGLAGVAAAQSAHLNPRLELSAPGLDQFAQVVFRIQTDGTFEQPHDAGRVKVDMLLSLPDGSSQEYPCFFVEQEGGVSHWEGRWTPVNVGQHKARVRIEADGGQEVSASSNFQVKSSARDGFLHVDGERMDAFVFDSGRSFRGLGANVGWEPRRRRRGGSVNHDYDHLLPLLASQGGNFIRTWMCPWNLALEWDQLRINHYSEAAALRLDELLHMAETNGIYIMLALDYHGALKTKPDYWGGNNYWEKHPYNKTNGGPCLTPTDFFTDPEARRIYRNRLRYLVARWGYHPHLAVWEFWNEIDLAVKDEGIPADAVVEWHREMAAYLKKIDPFRRPVSTSLSHKSLPGLWELEDMDFTMSHRYGPTAALPGQIRRSVARYEKPHVVGEFAYSWKHPNEIKDNDRFLDEFRSGLWLGVYAPTPILPLTWWWEHHEQRGEFKELQGVRRVLDFRLKNGNPEMPKETSLAAWSAFLEKQLTHRILPYWYDTTVDSDHGGYLLADSWSGPGKADHKQLVGHSRMVWGFAHAHRTGYRDDQRDYLAAARQGYQFLLDHFRDRSNGGYFWSVNLQGEPLNRHKIVYGQSFVMYALVEYFRASGDRDALDHALALYRVLQDKAHDADNSGWGEHFEAGWQPTDQPGDGAMVEIPGLKSANTHLHLMEAFTELYVETKDREVRRSLEESLRLNREWFYPPDPAQAAFHRHPDGRRAVGERSDGLSYGHNVEFAWLMIRAQKVLGHELSWEHFHAYIRHALEYGYDGQWGGLYNQGRGNEAAHDTEKVWWAQVELVAALSDALEVDSEDDKAYQNALLQTLQFAQQRMTDPRDGILFASINRWGEPKWGSKANDWKANYHDIRALVKFIQSQRE